MTLLARVLFVTVVVGVAVVDTSVQANQRGGTFLIDLPTLTKDDHALIQKNAREGLDGQPVGTMRKWENEATGHFGYTLLLANFDHTVNGMALKCRRIIHAIKTAESADMGIYRINLCKTPDGEWKWLN